VLSYKPGDVLSSGALYKKINADIYHSCEPSVGTYLAKKHVPGARHIATVRYPRDAHDWYLDFLYPSKNKWQVIKNYLYESNFIVRHSVRKLDGVYAPAQYMLSKIKRIYGLKEEPVFLPTPVMVPESCTKSATPQVLMMSRLDPRKRPEIFLSLADKFPEVTFHIAGMSRVPEYEHQLKEKYHQPNIVFHGFVDQFRDALHHDLMEKSWILLNCAILEGLPNAYLEAAAHQMAILSYVNPDDFASRFGFHAATDNFEEGLNTLLKNDNWKSQGMKGHTHVKETFSLDIAMDQHEKIYHSFFP